MIQEFTKEQLESEVWKDVIGYEGHYKVSSLGRVISLKRFINPSCIIKEDIIKSLCYDKNGYMITNFRLNNVVKNIKVHRLVMQHFTPNPENKPQVNHINGIKHDNRLENLEWCTQKENSWHCVNVIKTVARQKGEDKGCSKLTEKEVLEIREIYKSGRYTYRSLAEKYNCKKSNIYGILNIKIWTHI